jgi:nicotinate-nucleotide--dimethylbenzimidazole phosphoribosyltransferase
MASARERIGRLTMPPWALGELLETAVRLAGIRGTLRVPTERKGVMVMAGDHGVCRQGVSVYPSEVTAQMVRNFVLGGAAINVLARQMGARVRVVDMGVDADLSELVDSGKIWSFKVRRGTSDFSQGPAMSPPEARGAVEAGIQAAHRMIREGIDLLAVGEMGIGNTTSASALAAGFLKEPAERVTGRGTGVNEEQRRRKARVIEGALRSLRPDPEDPLDLLAKVGGFEIAGMAGVVLGAAAAGIPVVLDGFISTVAGLAAVRLRDRARSFCFCGHRSQEPGHRLVLEALGIRPLLDLEMRLGEGTGAVLAFPLMEAAVRILNEMATFEEAGVSGRDAGK